MYSLDAKSIDKHSLNVNIFRFKNSLKYILISTLDTRLTGELGAETSARKKVDGDVRKEFGEADTTLKTGLNADIKKNVLVFTFVLFNCLDIFRI